MNARFLVFFVFASAFACPARTPSGTAPADAASTPGGDAARLSDAASNDRGAIDVGATADRRAPDRAPLDVAEPPDTATADRSDARVSDRFVAVDVVTADAALTSGQCRLASDCNDLSSCTTDTCEQAVCVHRSANLCDWPAESGAELTNLTGIEGPAWDNDFYRDLSGAVYNPLSRRLWVVRNNGPSKVWAVVQDSSAAYVIDERGGQRAEWQDFGDAEGITQAAFEDEFIVFVLNEGGRIGEYDFSDYSQKVELHQYVIRAPGNNRGPEGITFVPDRFLTAQGFVDDSGASYTSQHGMGGLMFVGMQGDGAIEVYDLDRTSGQAHWVGSYLTGQSETAALEFDRSTGQLYIWHDADFDQLEVTRLSASAVPSGRRLDSLVTYSAPQATALQSTNREGFAIAPVEECTGGRRRAWMTVDGGRVYSLLLFMDFPC